jgi:hypothetical protein
MGWVPVRWSGYPLGHRHPSEPLRVQGWLDGAALGGAPRPSAVSPCAHQRRRVAAHPERVQQVDLLERSARPMGPVGVGQCRRRCRRCPQVQAAAHCCLPWPRRRNGRASRRRHGRVHRGRLWVRRAAPHGRPPPTAAAVPAGRRQSDSHKRMGAAARTRRRWSRRAAAPLAIASPTPAWRLRSTFVHSFRTRWPRHRTLRLHRWSCALAPARPSVEHDAPDLPPSSASPCACAAVPLRRAQ